MKSRGPKETPVAGTAAPDPRTIAARVPIALQQAQQAWQRRDFAQAAAIGRAILASVPGHPAALQLLGLVEAQRGQFGLAAQYLRQCVALDPRSVEARTNLATVLLGAGEHAQAIEQCREAIAMRPEAVNGWLVLARALAAAGQTDDALAAYAQVKTRDPGLVQAWLEHGHVLSRSGRHEEALESYDRAAALAPGSADTLNARGAALSALGRTPDALASYEAALAVNPAFAPALNNRANALRELRRTEEALAAYDRAVAADPNNADLWYNRGSLLKELDRAVDALAAFGRALAIRPEFAQALNNRGVVLAAMDRQAEAIDSYSRALAIVSDDAATLHNRGVALASVGRHEDAVADLETALALEDSALTHGALLSARMYCCDWHDHDAAVARATADVRAGRLGMEPFPFLAISTDPGNQLACARTWVEARYRPRAPGLWNGERYRHDRIRLAYVSADFREHPMAHLVTGLFEKHDRDRFEVYGISLARSDGSAARARLERAFEHFVDLDGIDAYGVATRLRGLEIDVAIDLNGFTRGSRMGAFAWRPAPVQVGYLGFPGTSGAPYLDYVLADETIIPPGERSWYAEEVAYRPSCYMVTDDRRAIASATPTREECGLPGDHFVFCCFNNSYKIAPAAFDTWMEILRGVPASVLWLIAGNPTAQANLRREAGHRGVDPRRLVFAERVPSDAHLARHRLADLSLDTWPYNAHTTAADCLWAGLPLLTLSGTTFAGRVAASLVRAIGVPELVADRREEYVAKAIALASDPGYLAAITARLRANRETTGLFDTARAAAEIEALYEVMGRTARSMRCDP